MMQMIKYSMLFLVFITSSLIGKMIAQKYSDRLKELQEMKNAFSIFKTKIKFTYEPIPVIFQEIAQTSEHHVKTIFETAVNSMKTQNASSAWEIAIECSKNNLKEEDKQILKTLSKMLGTTDAEGQISQIEVTETFLEKQIKQAEEERQKNEKMYRKLGSVIGLALVVILI